MIVRPATWDDAQILADLYKAANDELLALCGDAPALSLIYDGVAYALRAQDAVFLAVDEDGKAVGAIAWSHTPLLVEGKAVGFGTYVKPENRGAGVSKMLRDAAVQHCRTKGYSTIEGAVHVKNEAGLRSALSEGFVVTGYLVEKQL